MNKSIYTKYLDKLLSYITSEEDKNTIWKEIPNTNGMYFISNKGQVLSLFENKPRLRKPELHNKQYLRIGIKGKKYRINRLVAMLFLGEPENIENYEIHHIDLNPLNNNVDNLIWLTKEEHRKLHKQLRKKAKAENVKDK